MKTKTILGLFVFFALVILSVGFISAGPTCLTLTEDTVPTSVQNDQGSFQVTLNLQNGNQCNERSIDTVALTSMLNSANFGTWTINSAPTTLASGASDTIVATLSFNSGFSGTISTAVDVDATIVSSNTSESYSFVLSDIPIEQSPSLEINPETQVVELGENTSIEVENTGNVQLNNVMFSLVTTNIGTVTFNPTGPLSLGVGSTAQTVNVILDSLENLDFGFNSVQVKAEDTTTGAEDTAIIQVKKTFCSAGQAGGNLEIIDLNIENLDGDDNDWQILDEVEIEFEVENIGTEDIDDVVFELGLFSNGNDFADDLDWSSTDEEKVEVGDINEDDDEKHTFRFVVPVEFAERGNEDYMLAVKAYSDDLNEENECVDSSNDELSDDFFESVSVEVEDEIERAVIVHDVLVNGQAIGQATCGETVSGQFTVANIGEDDQERVRITMTNSELGVNQQFEITRDLDVGDDDDVFFNFVVPRGLQDKQYILNFKTEYEYDDGFYDEVSEDTFHGFLEVLGCSTTPLSNTGSGSSIITARLESSAVAGEELVVEATITNPGAESVTYTVGVTGYSSWADFDSISDDSITLNPGESRTVTIRMNVHEDTKGAQTFNIQTISGGIIETQEVEVNFEGSSTPSFNFGDSNLVWVIAIINIILILLIIIVAVRLSRR